MLKRTLDKLLSGVAFALAMLAGILLAAFSFFWFLIPKAKKEEREKIDAEANERVETVKREIAKAHAVRAEQVKFVIDGIEKKAEAQKAQDSVALANELLKEDA